jgi:hypothetical protein
MIERGVQQFEAERRVRSGESRAEVSRSMGIPLGTLAQWALAGGWRQKDIDAEYARETGEAVAKKVKDDLIADEARRRQFHEAARAAAEDSRAYIREIEALRSERHRRALESVQPVEVKPAKKVWRPPAAWSLSEPVKPGEEEV